jgi:PIN domain nuclease of toxin-antitoxin system
MERDVVILLDTHVVIWSVTDDPRLGPHARTLISEKTRSDPFYVSAITSWEIAMLVKKGRLSLGLPAQDWLAMAMEHAAWRTIPIDGASALESVNLPGDFHNDPADRFIVAAARLLNLSVVTADRAILKYASSGYVRAFDASL